MNLSGSIEKFPLKEFLAEWPKGRAQYVRSGAYQIDGLLVRYSKVSLHQGFFHIFHRYWAEENRSLYRGFRYTEVR